MTSGVTVTPWPAGTTGSTKRYSCTFGRTFGLSPTSATQIVLTPPIVTSSRSSQSMSVAPFRSMVETVAPLASSP